MTDIEVIQLKQEIGRTFTPSAPIDGPTLFAGRKTQTEKLMNAVFQKGQHAILFGERGVGKTSLTNVLKDLLRGIPQANFLIGTTNCEASSTFATIWHSVLREMPLRQIEKSAGFNAPITEKFTSLLSLLPSPDSAEGLRHLFQSISNVLPIVIIDEVDQIRSDEVRKRLADTIKTLSDHAVEATVILVGVADSVEQLIAEHVSIERALEQIKMPRMSVEELHEIIDKGLARLKMTTTLEIKQKISRLSQGLPHYCHLLSLHAAQHAATNRRRNISEDDLEPAIHKAVDGAQQTTVSAYRKATTSRRGNLYEQVLAACALAPKDDYSFFSSSDVRDPMTMIMGRRYEIPAFSQHLNNFCETERGAILDKSGAPRRYRFRFRNPLMEPYVIMKSVSKGLIPKDVLLS
jgi:Cdc6-like AAA superfamily ATPase